MSPRTQESYVGQVYYLARYYHKSPDQLTDEELKAAGELEFHGKMAGWAQPHAFQALLRQAVRQKWVVYAKRPFAGPRQVLAYLSRYTHRVAISPKRLLSLDEQSQTLTFAWKDYAQGSKHKTMRLEVKEFLRRFCLHLLPERFVKIRHFGFLSNRQRKACVAKARALLRAEGPAPDDSAAAPSTPAKLPAPLLCPHCGSDQLELIERVQPARPVPPAALDSS